MTPWNSKGVPFSAATAGPAARVAPRNKAGLRSDKGCVHSSTAMLGHRESILVQHGYQVRYEELLRYRGSSVARVCRATRADTGYFAFTADPQHQAVDHFRRIQAVQDSIP